MNMGGPITLLFVSAYSGLGGGENVQLNLIRALDRERFRVHLLCPQAGQFTEAAGALGVTVHTLPFRGASAWFVPAVWARLPAVERMAALMQEIGAQVVHSDYHALPYAVPAAHKVSAPTIWNAMGWWFPARRWQRAFFRERVAQIIAITRAVRDRWLARSAHFLPPERVPVLVPGVDVDAFRPGLSGAAVRAQIGVAADVPLVGMIARFQRVKGHDVFLEMAAHVLAELPQARFVVAGENVFGVARDEAYKRAVLERARSDPPLRRAVHYLGFWPDAREVIAAADVIVCPSRFESFGMVHLEAMAMARPVVSMNNGGPAETVRDGVTGFLVPPEAPRALAKKVLLLLRDRALRERMGRAGRQHVLEHFTAAGYAEKFTEIVEGMLWKSS